jgi:rod shape-determining protein MreC
MVRKSAAYPGIGDWLALAAAVVLSLLLIVPGSSFRHRAAGVLRSTVLYPVRLAQSYASDPVDPERELTRLRRRLARSRLDEAAQQSALLENERLRGLLDFENRRPRELVPCLVVGRAVDRFGETLTLSRGSGEGVTVGQTVVGIDGLVGVVTGLEKGECWVRTIRHGGLPVSGLLQQSRHVGVLRWNGRLRLLDLEGIPLDCPVAVGEKVHTSGHGRVFPKGVPVGAVLTVADDSTGLVKVILVRPAVDLDRLEEAFLVVPAAGDSSVEAATAGGG